MPNVTHSFPVIFWNRSFKIISCFLILSRVLSICWFFYCLLFLFRLEDTTIGTNKEKQEREADEDFLSRLIDEQPQSSDTTKVKSASTDMNKRSGSTYTSFTVRSFLKDVLQYFSTETSFTVIDPSSKTPTSSPGCSRLPIWRRLGRRPWHTADHVSPTRMEMYSKWRLRRKGWEEWVRDAKVKINKMAEKAEVQFKKK